MPLFSSNKGIYQLHRDNWLTDSWMHTYRRCVGRERWAWLDSIIRCVIETPSQTLSSRLISNPVPDSRGDESYDTQPNMSKKVSCDFPEFTAGLKSLHTDFQRKGGKLLSGSIIAWLEIIPLIAFRNMIHPNLSGIHSHCSDSDLWPATHCRITTWNLILWSLSSAK